MARATTNLSLAAVGVALLVGGTLAVSRESHPSTPSPSTPAVVSDRTA